MSDFPDCEPEGPIWRLCSDITDMRGYVFEGVSEDEKWKAKLEAPKVTSEELKQKLKSINTMLIILLEMRNL